MEIYTWCPMCSKLWCDSDCKSPGCQESCKGSLNRDNLKFDWCGRCKRDMTSHFELQFERKPRLRLEAKKWGTIITWLHALEEDRGTDTTCSTWTCKSTESGTRSLATALCVKSSDFSRESNELRWINTRTGYEPVRGLKAPTILSQGSIILWRLY